MGKERVSKKEEVVMVWVILLCFSHLFYHCYFCFGGGRDRKGVGRGIMLEEVKEAWYSGVEAMEWRKEGGLSHFLFYSVAVYICCHVLLFSAFEFLTKKGRKRKCGQY